MEKYQKNIKEFLTDVSYIVPVILIAILSFGYVITHESINVDTLSADRYFENGELIAQGRIGAVLIHKIFDIMEFNPFFVDFIAVIFLVLTAITFCMLFKEITKNQIPKIAYLIFSGFFISYPLIHEIFVYTPSSLSVGLGFFLIAISLIGMYEFTKTSKIRYVFMACFATFLAVGLYESFAPVYLCGMLITFILEGIYQEEEVKFVKLFKKGIIYILVLGVAVGFAILIPNICQDILGIEPSQNAAKAILYKTLGIKEGLRNVKDTIVLKYGIAAIYYLPITMYAIAVIICIAFLVASLWKKKKRWLSLCYFGLILSTMILSIIQGVASPYRTCQVFPLFVSCIFLLLTCQVKKIKGLKALKNLIIFLFFIMIFFQAKDLHKWFYLNERRYQYEKNLAIQVGEELEKNYNLEKPVVFVINRDIPEDIKEEIYVKNDTWQAELVKNLAEIFHIETTGWGKGKYLLKINETNVASYLTWAVEAFGEPNTEVLKFFHYLGYELKQGNVDMYLKARANMKNQPTFPREGSIIEKEEYIIVNL